MAIQPLAHYPDIENKPLIAVVSPFLDKKHGTERCVAEQLERLARDYEVHLYSNYVEDLDLSTIVWHRVPPLPGPHLIAYVWWLVANHFQRWWDGRFRELKYDLLYSPGINCFDADVISVHIVFSELYERVRDKLRLSRNPVGAWPRLAHRRLYYILASMLERRTYTRNDVPLLVVSRKVAADVKRHYSRSGRLSVVYHGWDRSRFGPDWRASIRPRSRQALALPDEAFVVLLIGNDWRNKGLHCLLEAVAQLQISAVKILVVGSDTTMSYVSWIRQHGLENRVQFLPLRRDVEFYYAAADAYVGPSLEDAFAMPPLEAMACGLPVIVSSQAGVSEIITHGVDGLIMEDPRDAAALSSMITDLYNDAALRQRLGENASSMALKYTWERNAEQLNAVLKEILTERRGAERCPEPVSC
jgi:UDP-glucose:(heptosyl)LPS alpha-1,3-glucosyltransferase